MRCESPPAKKMARREGQATWNLYRGQPFETEVDSPNSAKIRS
jgi:hypothetical protein